MLEQIDVETTLGAPGIFGPARWDNTDVGGGAAETTLESHNQQYKARIGRKACSVFKICSW